MKLKIQLCVTGINDIFKYNRNFGALVSRPPNSNPTKIIHQEAIKQLFEAIKHG